MNAAPFRGAGSIALGGDRRSYGRTFVAPGVALPLGLGPNDARAPSGASGGSRTIETPFFVFIAGKLETIAPSGDRSGSFSPSVERGPRAIMGKRRGSVPSPGG